MSLGAVGVLGTLWLVDDRASMLLTSKFYDLHLRGGLAPPEALRRAQDWLRGAKRRELVAYTQEAAKAGRVNANELARIAAGLRRSDMRVRLGSAVGGSEAGANVDDAHVGASSTAADQPSDVPPYAHPYFWGGFIYTGL
jgi:CHAT domain-containing protein